MLAIIFVMDRKTYALNSYFSVGALGAILMMILAAVGAISSWYSVGYIKSEVDRKIIKNRKTYQYFILLHLFIFAMFFALITTNLILMWIAIEEATTLSTAFLVSFYNKPSAIEVAWKYLTINSIGVLLGFFGTLLFLYPTVHSGFRGFMSWQLLLSNASAFDPFIAKIAFTFVLIGYVVLKSDWYLCPNGCLMLLIAKRHLR